MPSPNRVGLFLSAIALGLIVTSWGGTARADLIHSSPAPAPSADVVDVASQLQTVGLAPGDVAQRLAELTPADMAVLAENPEQVQCAGDAGSIAMIVGGVILLGVILYLILAEKL